jgi:caa(3)-type oxidase subunit IV
MAEAKALWRVARLPMLIWLALLVLLGASYGSAYIPLGKINLVISLAIAAIKALLVGAIFMRLREHNALNRLAACTGPIWIFIMFLLMGSDFFGR